MPRSGYCPAALAASRASLVSARYSSLAPTPVSRATTAAAGRARAPASTQVAQRRAAPRSREAAPRRRRADHQHDLAARRRSPRSARPARRRCRGALPRAACVSSRQTAAGRSASSSASARSVPREAARRLERHERLAGLLPAAAASSARLRGRKPTNSQRSAGRPEATSAVVTALGPGSTSTCDARRQALAHEREARIGHQRRARVGHQRHDRARAHARHQLARSRAFVVLVQAHQLAPTARGGRAARACGACPRRRPRRPPPEPSSTRSVTSCRLPIGVGHTTSRPAATSAGVMRQI